LDQSGKSGPKKFDRLNRRRVTGLGSYNQVPKRVQPHLVRDFWESFVMQCVKPFVDRCEDRIDYFGAPKRWLNVGTFHIPYISSSTLPAKSQIKLRLVDFLALPNLVD
jgi:hypothetical protein